MSFRRRHICPGDLIYIGTLFAFYPSTDPIIFKQSVDKISCLNKVRKILPAHNDVNVPINMIEKVKEAFEYLEKNSLLFQGSGIFKFGSFNIHI